MSSVIARVVGICCNFVACYKNNPVILRWQNDKWIDCDGKVTIVICWTYRINSHVSSSSEITYVLCMSNPFILVASPIAFVIDRSKFKEVVRFTLSWIEYTAYPDNFLIPVANVRNSYSVCVARHTPRKQNQNPIHWRQFWVNKSFWLVPVVLGLNEKGHNWRIQRCTTRKDGNMSIGKISGGSLVWKIERNQSASIWG